MTYTITNTPLNCTECKTCLIKKAELKCPVAEKSLA